MRPSVDTDPLVLCTQLDMGPDIESRCNDEGRDGRGHVLTTEAMSIEVAYFCSLFVPIDVG